MFGRTQEDFRRVGLRVRVAERLRASVGDHFRTDDDGRTFGGARVVDDSRAFINRRTARGGVRTVATVRLCDWRECFVGPRRGVVSAVSPGLRAAALGGT